MFQFDGFLSLLDSRSFGSVWYWIVFAGFWIRAGHHVVGVPNDVVLLVRQQIRRKGEEPEKYSVLLDWLSLSLPRWQIGHKEALVLLALGMFILTSLAILGFRYGLEMAQALTFLLIPWFIIMWLRLRLARRLLGLLQAAQAGEEKIITAARDACMRIVWHKRLILSLAILSAVVTTGWGVFWTLTHPNGM